MLLRDLLAMRDLRLRLLAGDPDTVFSAVNVTDLPDPGPYVSPGDLVLSGLMWRRAETDSDVFAAALARAGAAALGAGEALLGEVPPDLVAACARHGFALVAVPADVPFSTVGARVAAAAAARREREFAAVLERSRGLVEAVAAGGGLDRAVSLLAAETAMSCMVLTPTGRVVAATSPPEQPQVRWLVRGYLTAQRLPAVVGRAERAWTVDSAATQPAARLAGWLVAGAGDRASWPPVRTEAVRALRAAAALEQARLDQAGQWRRRLLRELVEGLLAGGQPESTAVDRLRALGCPDDGRYLVATAELPGRPRPARWLRALVDDAVRHVAADPVTCCYQGSVVALVPAAPGRSSSAGPDVAAVADALTGALGLASAGWPRARLAVGLSAVATAHELTGLLDEARYACRLAAGGGRVTVATSADIASHLLLLAMVPDDARRVFVDRVLGPVLRHDAAHHGELLATLRCFLDCGGSWSTSAQRMHLHPNSVRYRVRQVERLTGRRLSNTSDRVDLFLAVRAFGEPEPADRRQ